MTAHTEIYTVRIQFVAATETPDVMTTADFMHGREQLVCLYVDILGQQDSVASIERTGM